MFDIEYGFIGLFITCFLAATVLPVASELFLGTILAMGYDPILSLIIATTGNTLGGWLNYGIGYLGKPEWLIKLGATKEKIENWKQKINQYGVWLALLSWLPFVGDVIGIALGFFRANLFLSFLFIAIGKFIRYAVIIFVFLYFK